MPNIPWTPELTYGNCVYFDGEDVERLSFDSLDEYVFSAAHDLGLWDKELGVNQEVLDAGHVVEVFCYARGVPSRLDFDFLDDLLEQLDCEYGDPDGDYNGGLSAEDLEEFRELERAFGDKLEAKYKSYCCEIAMVVDVPLREWYLNGLASKKQAEPVGAADEGG